MVIIINNNRERSIVKKTILITTSLLSLFGCNGKETTTTTVVAKDAIALVEYKEEYKEELLEIAFEDPNLFFPGRIAMPEGMLEQVDAANKQELIDGFSNPLKYTKVLVDNALGKPVGFTCYLKTREQSLESTKNMLAEKQPSLKMTDEQILQIHPQLKLTDVECKDYILIESVIVSREYRGNGYGRMLIKNIVEECKQKWPNINMIKLMVSKDNTVACKLYESEGFTVSKDGLHFPPQLLQMLKTTQYEKNIR